MTRRRTSANLLPPDDGTRLGVRPLRPGHVSQVMRISGQASVLAAFHALGAEGRGRFLRRAIVLAARETAQPTK
ncbi:MAG: hypothetical protein IT355_12110 [Gemmatimonadaceae bacterium]|nr:hypothetical protein [Gemmatimonadaceae bacterium]